MATSSLPLLDDADSLKLRVENKTRNVFVTQAAPTRYSRSNAQLACLDESIAADWIFSADANKTQTSNTSLL